MSRQNATSFSRRDLLRASAFPLGLDGDDGLIDLRGELLGDLAQADEAEHHDEDEEHHDEERFFAAHRSPKKRRAREPAPDSLVSRCG